MRENKNLLNIRQISMILLLTLPLITLIAVSALVLSYYHATIKSEFTVGKRPSTDKTVEELQKDFTVMELKEKSDYSVSWENSGNNIMPTTNNTFAIVADYPVFANEGKVKKVYEIKLNENIRAKKDLFVNLKDMQSYFINKTNDQSTNDSIDSTSANEQFLEIESIKWLSSDDQPLDDKKDTNNLNLGKTLLLKGPKKLPGETDLITEAQLKADPKLFEKFKEQYEKSDTIKLEINFKINQVKMENKGLWDANSNYLNSDGQIKLGAQFKVFTDEN
ncbi:MAG: hypothetical protein QFY14_00640 [Candidatus Phytoplasma pruni]|nr:hypothetical protein [Candidatus Phytoplasma pruni]